MSFKREFVNFTIVSTFFFCLLLSVLFVRGIEPDTLHSTIRDTQVETQEVESEVVALSYKKTNENF